MGKLDKAWDEATAKGWTVVRDVHTMAGRHNHAEIRIEDLHVPNENMLGGRGQGHLLDLEVLLARPESHRPILHLGAPATAGPSPPDA